MNKDYEEMWVELKEYLEARDSELFELFQINRDNKFAWRGAELRNVVAVIKDLENGE